MNVVVGHEDGIFDQLLLRPLVASGRELHFLAQGVDDLKRTRA